MPNAKTNSVAHEADPFLAEIRRLRGRADGGSGEEWVERAVDLKVDQLLDLSECLRELEPSSDIAEIKDECDRIVEEMVTGRLGGEEAVGRTEAFLCRAASLIMERLMEEIEE
ncbi:hypothetical protein P0O24_10605 [Methanotrichaceae archaeon M04Ac]|uniref:Uncharacterized protein n=1 Tax=Candidatus Methanocrinis alkalitolerans TaxID=3033395 RepID=A0ABT5XH43_9EURY|nr:hypothetical protein [Candidatus Methanocrinis alkalitolerans]MCR3884403.1 hypothetical protein [Methanothrix sp.]MDF0594029.1 hypothetical protein [Candidatus Methanocrinis alkalitolerans]